MADAIGTIACPQVLSVRFERGIRRDEMCPNTAYVYQDGPDSYHSECSGSYLVPHTHNFGGYYLGNMTPLP